MDAPLPRQASQLSAAQLALDQGACPDARQGFDGGGGGLAPRGVTAAQRSDEVLQGAEEALVCGREPMGEGSGRHMTATMWAARRGQAELLRLLGQRQADVNLRDTRGWTAVLWGALKGDVGKPRSCGSGSKGWMDGFLTAFECF